jgi:hypothetical protein
MTGQRTARRSTIFTGELPEYLIFNNAARGIKVLVVRRCYYFHHHQQGTPVIVGLKRTLSA